MAAIPNTIDYAGNITAIDTEQQRNGMACCYLMRSGDGYAFIECGTSLSIPGLLAVLEARDIDPAQVDYVMPTHVHLDHAGGAGLLMQSLPNARLVVHPRGARHMVDPSKLIEGATEVYGAANMAAMYGEILPVAERRVIVADDDLELDFRGRKLRFIDAPGHARHHYAIWDTTSRGWFTGDTFGISYREFDGPNGPFVFPTTTPVQFDPEAWAQTLERFMAVDPAWMYLTHYGRVGDTHRLAADLRGGIAVYQSLAQQLINAPHRHEALKQALLVYALEEIAALSSPIDEARASELLAMDIDLNAQGLGVWLDRQKAA